MARVLRAALIAAAPLAALPAAAQMPQGPLEGSPPLSPVCLDERCLNLPPSAEAGKAAAILAPSALPEDRPTPSRWRLIGSVRRGGAVELKRGLLSW